MATYHPRQVKAEWGIPCNQDANGDLWTGKGYKKTLASQLSAAEAAAIKRAIDRGRGDRCGRFWVDREKKIVTMMVGASEDNTPHKESY